MDVASHLVCDVIYGTTQCYIELWHKDQLRSDIYLLALQCPAACCGVLYSRDSGSFLTIRNPRNQELIRLCDFSWLPGFLITNSQTSSALDYSLGTEGSPLGDFISSCILLSFPEGHAVLFRVKTAFGPGQAGPSATRSTSLLLARFCRISRGCAPSFADTIVLGIMPTGQFGFFL